ncbi:MAG: arsenate reductase (glutaredoxin) [Betaproteobacteria bacterium]|nr:MAG: arsenate reductase (glutaredoxin) [Betaproteobacteria bacterium]
MATGSVTIYHNPRCSKSRKTLALLEEHGIEPTVVEYLKNPPDKQELGTITRKLGMKPEQIVRRGEASFKEHFAGKSLNDDEWLDALAEYPILIERPIVVKGDRAVIGRPPENVLDLV